jgi:hypothetical protein
MKTLLYIGEVIIGALLWPLEVLAMLVGGVMGAAELGRYVRSSRM